jgi:hypothetical protein
MSALTKSLRALEDQFRNIKRLLQVKKKMMKKGREHQILLRAVRVASRGKKKKRQKNGWFSPTGKLLSAGIFQRKIDRLHKKSGKEAAAQGLRNARKKKRIIKEKEAKQKRNARKKKRIIKEKEAKQKRDAAKRKRIIKEKEAKQKCKANKEAKQKRKADKKHKAKQNTERDLSKKMFGSNYYHTRISPNRQTVMNDYGMFRDELLKTRHGKWDSDSQNRIVRGDYFGFITGPVGEEVVRVCRVSQVLGAEERPTHWKSATPYTKNNGGTSVAHRHAIVLTDKHPLAKTFEWRKFRKITGLGRDCISWAPRCTQRVVNNPWKSIKEAASNKECSNTSVSPSQPSGCLAM